jgi:Flp pilus assembly pilin Flp
LKEKYEMLKLYTKAQMLMASLKDESGQDLIEYCIVAAVVVLAAVAATPGLQGAITAAVAKLTTAIASV